MERLLISERHGTGGVRVTYEECPDGTTVIRTIGTTMPIIEDNKARQTDGTRGYTPCKDWRRAAHIPNIIAHAWLHNYGVNLYDPDHAPAVERLLNSNEWRHLRTAEFNI